MKKLFIMGLAAMGLALTACNSDETVEMAKGKAIGFSSFVDKSTRATDITLANLDSIEVYGWRGDHQIFDKQKVTINAESGEGTYSPIQYWEAKTPTTSRLSHRRQVRRVLNSQQLRLVAPSHSLMTPRLI